MSSRTCVSTAILYDNLLYPKICSQTNDNNRITKIYFILRKVKQLSKKYVCKCNLPPAATYAWYTMSQCKQPMNAWLERMMKRYWASIERRQRATKGQKTDRYVLAFVSDLWRVNRDCTWKLHRRGRRQWCARYCLPCRLELQCIDRRGRETKKADVFDHIYRTNISANLLQIGNASHFRPEVGRNAWHNKKQQENEIKQHDWWWQADRLDRSSRLKWSS